MKHTLSLFICAAALSLSGCVTRVADVGIDTANAQSNIMATQVQLATYSPAPANFEAISALCNTLRDAKAERNAGWEFVKGVGGLALRTVGVVATAAGYPVAGAIDLVVDVAGEAESVVADVNDANSALITSNRVKCKAVGVDIV